MSAAGRTPIISPVRLVHRASPAEPTAATSVVVDPGEPVFEGHYPGFPIFPGVCLVECVHRSALATVPDQAQAADGREPTGAMVLEAVESARFLGAVYPGDRIDLDLTFRAQPAGWRVAAKIRGGRGDVASVRLRYRIQEPA